MDRLSPVGLLLAAGMSRRFGSDKRFYRLDGGMPMALRSVASLRHVCERVLVVVRGDDDLLAAQCEGLGCEVVRNLQADSGIGNSLALGVLTTREADGWLVALADMPFIQPVSYHAVIAALQRGAQIVRPRYRGRPGHPVGFAASWRDLLLTLAGDRGARDIVAAAGEACELVDLDDPGVVRDVDQPTDASRYTLPWSATADEQSPMFRTGR